MTRTVHALVVAFVLLPVAAILIAATSVNFAHGPWGDGVTTQWLQTSLSTLGPLVLRSLQLALVVVLIDLALASVLSWWIARHRSSFSRAAGYLLNIPLAVPGIALSVALVSAFPQLRPSGLLLIAAHVVFTLPFAVAALAPALADSALLADEEVAGTLGARPFRVVTTITLPACALALTQAAAMVFALSFGEFNISFFVNPPADPTVPFALFDAFSTQRLEQASAHTVVFIAAIVPVLALIVRARRSPSRRPS